MPSPANFMTTRTYILVQILVVVFAIFLSLFLMGCASTPMTEQDKIKSEKQMEELRDPVGWIRLGASGVTIGDGL